MSPCGLIFRCRLICFPRVSGDEPDEAMHGHLDREFSPRERG